MHLLLLIFSYTLTLLVALSILVYSPMAGSWKRALLVPAVLTLLWGGVRTVSIIAFREPEEPVPFGFIVAPFLAAFYAALVRSAKIVLFRIPLLSRWEKAAKTRLHGGIVQANVQRIECKTETERVAHSQFSRRAPSRRH
jgi:hypothetical protein